MNVNDRRLFLLLLIIFSVTTHASESGIDKERKLNSNTHEQIQFVGQAVLKARNLERKELEAEFSPLRQRVAAFKRELLSMRRELLAPHFEDGQLSVQSQPTNSRNLRNLNLQNITQERAERINSHKHKLRESMKALKISLNKLEPKGRAKNMNARARQKLDALDIEMNSVLAAPASRQLEDINALVDKIHAQKLLVFTEEKKDTPTISTPVKHR